MFLLSLFPHLPIETLLEGKVDIFISRRASIPTGRSPCGARVIYLIMMVKVRFLKNYLVVSFEKCNFAAKSR